MKISILLPYKENFSATKAGAVSLYVKDITSNSKFKKNIKIYGETQANKTFLSNFTHLDTKDKFYLSKTKVYINEFLKREKKEKSSIIEIHNRPSYVSQIRSISNSRIIIYFHNDPLTMKGSILIKDRKNLLKKSQKIIFNSNWCKNRFIKDLNIQDYQDKISVIPQSTSKTNIDFKKKKKIISFVGKLNSAKGYDVFGKAIVKILDEFNDWSSIVIGDEPREKLIFDHKKLKLYGFKSNSFILNKLKYVSISVVPSKWDEPFGRSSLEASSRGCALIISNSGGLKETTNNALILKNVSSNEIYKYLKKLIINSKLRTKLQKRAYKNFYLTNQYVSKLIDKLRSDIISNDLPDTKKNKKTLKILHITNLNERFDGRLHYNTGKRLTNGFVKLGHNVLTISDRDIIRHNRSFRDLSGSKKLNTKILNTNQNFKPDLIVLGHADSVNTDTILKLKKHAKICQWFLDPLIKTGPDYKKNYNRIKAFDTLIDASFLTTHPSALNFKIHNSFFMPNPIDEAFEILNNSKSNPRKDLFFAMSHGVHRGILKKGKIDEREFFLKKLQNKITDCKFDIFGMNNNQPIWGDDFLNNIKNYKMGLNLSRGKPIKYYSSDRLAQIMGNGLLTFIDKNTLLNRIIDKDCAVFYKNIDDLANKIIYFKNNPIKLKKIASKGKKFYTKNFNSKLVCSYIINKTFKINNKTNFIWD